MFYIEIMKEYGQPILHSEEFRLACYQRHHYASTVALHSINVAIVCILLSKVFQHLDLHCLVIAALVHDLGILGRNTKYTTCHDCIFMHPVESAEVLQRLVPNVENSITNAVTAHMFPLCKTLPKSKEAWVLTMADKIAAIGDILLARRLGVVLNSIAPTCA